MSEYKYSFKKFIKDWMLIIGMIAGVGIYLIYRSVPFLHPVGPAGLAFCKFIQPVLLFAMLFLSFCKIEPQQMRPHRWMFKLLLIQGAMFAGLALLIRLAGSGGSALALYLRNSRLFLEAAALCLICPTATACAVVTGKLGGNMAAVVTYTTLINIEVAFLVPAFVPLIYPQDGMNFSLAFAKILAKVFPLLIMPCITAWLVRYLLPRLHKTILKYSDWSFYIWSTSLALAIMMSTRGIAHSDRGLTDLLGIALASGLACAFQFWTGKRIGSRYSCRISAGQAMGQKNTVFAIWMGYTFMDPVVSVSGGFYSIFHNTFNTYQLYRRRKEIEAGKEESCEK